MYDQMKEYVKNYLHETEHLVMEQNKQYPFRSRFEHSMRVLEWAKRINRIEMGDEETVEIAAIFHDIGKNVSLKLGKPHGEISGELCAQYLKSINFNEEKTERIVQAVSLHSLKNLPTEGLNLEDRILMDADLLDETGAICVLWDCLYLGSEDNSSYDKAYYRILDNYHKIKDQIKYIKTNEGMRLFLERIYFLEQFLDNLRFELGI